MRHAQPSCQTRCMDSKRETAGRQVTQPEDEHPTSADPTDGKTKKTRIQNTRPQSHPPVWTNQTAILPCKCGTPFHRSFEPSFITTLRLQCLNMDQHYAEFGVGSTNAHPPTKWSVSQCFATSSNPGKVEWRRCCVRQAKAESSQHWQ